MLRFTTRAGFPLDASVLQLSGGLFGGSCEPFHIESAVRSKNPASAAVRCTRCGGYWWPGCNWRSSNWVCGLCGEENAQGRMPSPEELRELVILYKDEDSLPGKEMLYFFLVDLESNEALIDASMLAIGAAATTVPSNARITLAVSKRDALTLYEFDDNSEDFMAVTTRLRTGSDGRFRSELKDTSTIRQASCSQQSVAFVRALNSIKVRKEDDDSPINSKASCIGRSIESVVEFISNASSVLFGAQVLVFSDCLRMGLLDSEAITRALIMTSGEVSVGIDYYYVSSASQTVVDESLVALVNGSGGDLFDHSFADLDENVLTETVKNRCQRTLVFGGMIKARTCPELSVISSGVRNTTKNSASAWLAKASNPHSPQEWWILSVLKNAALSLMSTLVIGSEDQDQNQRREGTGRGSTTNIFLGKGQTIPQDRVWTIPVADAEDFSLAFELEFARADGLAFFAYPRSMAVQIASTFITSQGERFVRVETRSCETDRPIRSPGEVWQTADWKQYAFLLVRLLVFSGQYDANDYRDIVLDWSAKVIASGCGMDRFERKLGKLMFGLIRLLEVRDADRMRLLGECNPDSLDRLLWPQMLAFPGGKMFTKLSLDEIFASTKSMVIEATSDILVVPAEPLSQADDEALRAHVSGLAQKSFHRPKVHFVPRSALMQTDYTSPVGVQTKSALTKSVNLLVGLMHEDPSAQWPAGYSGFLEALNQRGST